MAQVGKTSCRTEAGTGMMALIKAIVKCISRGVFWSKLGSEVKGVADIYEHSTINSGGGEAREA